MGFYVEFRCSDEDRYARLVAVVDALRAAKDADLLTAGPQWRVYFDDRALAHFWWPTPEERLPRVTETRWDFDSLIDAFANGEYALLGVRRTGDLARIEFEPSAHPYGGTGCMAALIEAFDLPLVKISD